MSDTSHYEHRYKMLEMQIQDLRAEQHEIASTIDEKRLGLRPQFPTVKMLEAIRAALTATAEGHQTKLAHGDPAIPGDYTVCFTTGRRNWIIVRDGAPFKFRGGGKLWSFTDDEVQVMVHEMDAAGFTVTDHWPHDVGHSFVIAKREVKTDAEES